MSLWSRWRNPAEPAEAGGPGQSGASGAHLRLGRKGEEAARAELERMGMTVLCANYRHGRGEIDLIVRDGEVLAFVEVKSRSSESWVRPAQAVGRAKQRMLSDTALAYLNATPPSPEQSFADFLAAWRAAVPPELRPVVDEIRALFGAQPKSARD